MRVVAVNQLGTQKMQGFANLRPEIIGIDPDIITVRIGRENAEDG